MREADKIPRIQMKPALCIPFSKNRLGIPKKKINKEAAETSFTVLKNEEPITMKNSDVIR